MLKSLTRKNIRKEDKSFKDKTNSFTKKMENFIVLYLFSFSSVIFNIGTLIQAVVILEYFAVIYFIFAFVSNFLLQSFVGTLWMSKIESAAWLEFRKKEGKIENQIYLNIPYIPY